MKRSKNQNHSPRRDHGGGGGGGGGHGHGHRHRWSRFGDRRSNGSSNSSGGGMGAVLVVPVVLFVGVLDFLGSAWLRDPAGTFQCAGVLFAVIALMGLLGGAAFVHRRRLDRMEAELERPAAIGLPSVAVLLVAVPSARRAEASEAARGESGAYRLLTELIEREVLPAESPGLASLVTTEIDLGTEGAVAAAARVLAGLAARDRSAVTDGFRAPSGTLSTSQPGLAVLAVAVITQGGAPAPALAARADLRAAIDVVLPIEPARILYLEVRWIPSAEHHAFDLATLARAFPEIVTLA